MYSFYLILYNMYMWKKATKKFRPFAPLHKIKWSFFTYCNITALFFQFSPSVWKPGVGFWKTGTRVLFSKTRVPGSGFGFSKMYQIDEFWLKKTTKLALFGQKVCKFQWKLPNWRFFVHKMGTTTYDFFVNFVYLHMYYIPMLITIFKENS